MVEEVLIFFWVFIFVGYLAGEGEVSDSPSMGTPTSTWSSSQTLVVPVMCTLFQSKGPGLVGKQCPEIGARTGKATPTSMAKASLSRSLPVMAAQWCPTMLPQLGGPLGRPTVVPNSARAPALFIFSHFLG